MHILLVVLIGLAAGILGGTTGIGGGSVIVPALVYLVGMDQHMAQGTSLFILLLPVGIGGLSVYWKKSQVDVAAGLLCAFGFLIGGYLGGRMAISISSRTLQGIFGLFLIFSALMLWRQSRSRESAGGGNA